MSDRDINMMVNNADDPENFGSMQLIYKHKSGKIYLDNIRKRLFVRWWGYQDQASIKTIGTKMAEKLKTSGFDQVLNCNQFVKGSFSQMDEWILDVWLPMMINAGLKNFAWILSPDELSKQSAALMVSKDEDSLLFKFNTLKEGEQWLNKLNKKKISKKLN